MTMKLERGERESLQRLILSNPECPVPVVVTATSDDGLESALRAIRGVGGTPGKVRASSIQADVPAGAVYRLASSGAVCMVRLARQFAGYL
jgi:hypothetical protein